MDDNTSQFTQGERNPELSGSDGNISGTAYPRHRPLRRFGCAFGLLLWALLLLSPCPFIILAIQGQIVIDTGDAPEQQLRLWLIMEADQRGIGFSQAFVERNGDEVCVETNVQFLLWQGDADPVKYCQCYLNMENMDTWSLSETYSGDCTGDE
jgi:hypothetical protein